MLYYYDKFNINNASNFLILTSNELQLVNNTASNIKKSWQQKNNILSQQLEKTILTYNNTNNWQDILQSTKQKSLFTPFKIYEIYFDSKTLDLKAKKAILEYLDLATDNDTLIIIYANNLGLKESKWLQENHRATFLRLSFSHKKSQEDLSIYDLSGICLQGDLEKTLTALECVKNNTDLNLILWGITRDLKIWIELKILDINNPNNLEQNLKKSNIWSKNFKEYQDLLKKFSLLDLYRLLQHCSTLDYWMKTGKNKAYIWPYIQTIVSIMCLGPHHNSLDLIVC